MTDLLLTLPNFPTNSYTHLLPSLEKHFISTTDLLTLDAIDIAKRAQLPPLDVRRLANHVVAALQGQLGLGESNSKDTTAEGENDEKRGFLRKSGREVASQWNTISTLDPSMDAALGGGIPTGYITEITGESGAGKTQLLLTLLLSAQLPPPHGLSRPTLYISTEHALPTPRLHQILSTNPFLTDSPTSPSLDRILTLQTPDLESQDHILTYQLPVALPRHNISLVIIDSIAANYRAEHASSSMAQRTAELVRLGHLLRSLARTCNCAIVVANQVADRFDTEPLLKSNPPSSPPRMPPPQHPYTGTSTTIPSSSASLPPTSSPTSYTPLTLDHQLRFFTGWGDIPTPNLTPHPRNLNLKTPSLGLVWANQISCRIALVKELAPAKGSTGEYNDGGVEWNARRWRRWMRVVFAAWVGGVGEGESGVEIEIWAGGVRGVAEGKAREEGSGDESGGVV